MQIQLTKSGKKYNRTWIFRDLSYTFTQDASYALLGNNGSGKSTLLQILAGYQSTSEGEISWTFEGKLLRPEKVFNHICLAAPYLELPEEMTLNEVLRFHTGFKKPLMSQDEIIDRLGFSKETDKQLRNFSSGMKQKLKLALAFFFHSEILFLDEPCSHLDVHAIQWYLDNISEFSKGRLVIVASNDELEYGFCENLIQIADFKKKAAAV